MAVIRRRRAVVRKRVVRKRAAPRRKRANKYAITGYGAYKPPQSNLESTLAKFDIPLAPRSLGSEIGGWIGHGAHTLVKALTGFGDYRIDKNSLMMGGMSPPQIVNSSNHGGVIVRHREYLTDILSSTGFQLASYPINPGVSATFPWLSQVAQGFEEYKFRGLVFEFKTMSADNVLSTNASTSLGSVICMTNYNVLNSNPIDKRTMENYEFANSSKPSCSFYHPVECKRSLNPLVEMFIRTGAVPAHGDARLYDIGNFCIATEGMQQSTGILGELWCTYEVELYKPKFTEPFNTKTDHFQGGGFTGGSAQGILGSNGNTIASTSNSIGCTVTVSGSPQFNTTITFPSEIVDGTYTMDWIGTMINGSTGNYLAPSIDSTTNIVPVKGYINNTSDYVATPSIAISGLGGSQFLAFQHMFDIDTSQAGNITPASITWFPFSCDTTGKLVTADLYIKQINANMP